MTVIGHTRVGTTDQGRSIQEAALRSAGCGTVPGSAAADHDAGPRGAAAVLDFLRPGDDLM